MQLFLVKTKLQRQIKPSHCNFVFAPPVFLKYKDEMNGNGYSAFDHNQMQFMSKQLSPKLVDLYR